MSLILVTAVAIDYTKFIELSQRIKDPRCLLKNYSMVVIRAYLDGRTDHELENNIKLIKKEGKNTEIHVTVLVSPKHRKRPDEQAIDIANVLRKHGIKNVWVVVGTYGDVWDKDMLKNKKFMAHLAAAMRLSGMIMGIRTSQKNWERFMGRNSTEFSPYPLWYTKGKPSPQPADFKPFGGWKKPMAKMYLPNQTFCGNVVSLNAKYANMTADEEEFGEELDE